MLHGEIPLCNKIILPYQISIMLLEFCYVTLTEFYYIKKGKFHYYTRILLCKLSFITLVEFSH